MDNDLKNKEQGIHDARFVRRGAQPLKNGRYYNTRLEELKKHKHPHGNQSLQYCNCKKIFVI